MGVVYKAGAHGSGLGGSSAAGHDFTLPSWAAAARALPSGENAAEWTEWAGARALAPAAAGAPA
jgi:hypothetical protein